MPQGCIETRPIQGCFRPLDGSDPVDVVIHIIYENGKPIGQSYTLSDSETPIDITSYLGGGTISVGACAMLQVTKHPICFESGGLHYKGWEIETFNVDTCKTVCLKAVDRNRTIEVDMYTVVDCQEPPIAPIALDDSGFQTITGQSEGIAVSFNDTPCLTPEVTSYMLIGGSEINAVVTPAVSTNGLFNVTAGVDGDWSFEYEILCNGAFTGQKAVVSGTALTLCSVGVSNVSFDSSTCTLSVVGTGATNLEFSIDGGANWFGDGDTDYEFFDCFPTDAPIEIFVRDADDIACQSPIAYEFTIDGRPMLYIGKKNNLSEGLNEQKEADELTALISDGYDVHYVNVGYVKNNWNTLADMLAEHPCVKFIYVTGEAKDMKDVPLFLTWDIPIILSGNKDLYKELKIGDKNGHESDPKDQFFVETNIDGTGILNTYAIGDTVIFSTEGEKTIWVDPSGTDIVNLGSISGNDNEAAVWYVPPGGIYNEDGDTTTNYVFGMPWHKDAAKSLNAAGQQLIQETAAFAYENGNNCT